ncbi:MAG TPA: 3-methyladenine DNA glycosylase [Gemmata sp.]|nr:3-methyladenine DNA glycosylase [Gemmata sp.]
MTNVQLMSRSTWQAAKEAYLERVRPWADDRLQRMSRGQKHPVYDFLFEYYSFRPSHLLRWSPGTSIILEEAGRDDVCWSEFIQSGNGLSLSVSSFPDHRVSYLQWAVRYLRATLAKEPDFTCLGLHEWAMVYRDPDVRHPYVPFRLTREETDEFVESQSLHCSHYDAYRFFTPRALPRNRWELSRAATTEHDQPGCLHVNMDLYRLAYKIAPFCPSRVLADAFDLARCAREVDMRASPYDLKKYGFLPLKIEIPEGRAEYAELQREIHRHGRPVRERLLGIYAELLSDRRI